METSKREKELEYLKEKINKIEGIKKEAWTKLYELEKQRIIKLFNFLRWLLLSIFAFLSFLISKIDFANMSSTQQWWNVISLSVACFLFIWIAIYLSIESTRISTIDMAFATYILKNDKEKRWDSKKYRKDFKNDVLFLGITMGIFVVLVLSLFFTTILPFLELKGFID